MKKNSLTTAIIAGVAGVAGLAGVAHAVNLNPDGIGQVLLYPYYTTNGGNSTLITVVNTADVGKAVKVRFLEALNSKEVLDFNLYLSPYDVWSANITLEGGEPGIWVGDRSCIAPNGVMPDLETGAATFTAFRNYEFQYWRPDALGLGRYHNTLAGVNGYDPITSAMIFAPLATADEQNETRKLQGHIEVLEMGDLGGDPAYYALHVNGTPRDCSYFHQQWTNQRWRADSSSPWEPTWLAETGSTVDNAQNANKGLHDVYPPGSGYLNAAGQAEFRDVGGPGGIFGSAYIVNGAEGTAYSYNAEAINGFYTIGEGTAGEPTDRNLHYAPGTVWPTLYNATNAYDPGTGLYYAVARVFDAAGHPYDLAFQRSNAPEAVSAVLMARYVANEYAIGGVTNASSDWVITFPTKQLHTYRNPEYSTTAAGLRPFSTAQGFAGRNVFAGSWQEVFTMDYWDREEGEPFAAPGALDVSPLPPPGQEVVLGFRQEANVLTFYTKGTDAQSVLAAPPGIYGGGYAVALEEGFRAGWARIGFGDMGNTRQARQYLTSLAVAGLPVNGQPQDFAGRTLNGLPVVGFWAAKHNNAQAAEGVSAFYNIIHRHRVTREIQ